MSTSPWPLSIYLTPSLVRHLALFRRRLVLRLAATAAVAAAPISEGTCYVWEKRPLLSRLSC